MENKKFFIEEQLEKASEEATIKAAEEVQFVRDNARSIGNAIENALANPEQPLTQFESKRSEEANTVRLIIQIPFRGEKKMVGIVMYGKVFE